MSKEFKEKGYFVARNFIDKDIIDLAANYFHLTYSDMEHKKSKKKTHSTDWTNDVAGTVNFVNDKLTGAILLKYGPKISKLLDYNLTATYTYARAYVKGDDLLAHIDRPSCEISATCPVFDSNDSPSVIYISKYKWWDVSNDEHIAFTYDEIKDKGPYERVELYPGDALFYKGCEHFHWREPLKSDLLFQFFMHMVDNDGPHTEWAFDKKSGFAMSK
jgi:hypothetical protein